MHAWIPPVCPEAVLTGITFCCEQPSGTRGVRDEVSASTHPTVPGYLRPAFAGGAADNGIPLVYHLASGIKTSASTHFPSDRIHTPGDLENVCGWEIR